MSIFVIYIEFDTIRARHQPPIIVENEKVKNLTVTSAMFCLKIGHLQIIFNFSPPKTTMLGCYSCKMS